MDHVGEQCSMLKQITEEGQKRKREEDEEMMSGVEYMIFFFNAVHEEAINKGKSDQKPNEFSNQVITRQAANTDQLVKPEGKRPKLMKADTCDVPRVYSCEICGRNFSSYHAKGGHMVKHYYKGKNELKNKLGAETKNAYKCKKCDKVFETPQYLGGHMRAHYEPKHKVRGLPVNIVKEITEDLKKLSLSTRTDANEDVNLQLSLGQLPTQISFDLNQMPMVE